MMKMAHHPSTRCNKRLQVVIYQSFCDNHDLLELPANEWQLCRYAMYTVERVMVKKNVSGIRNLQQLAGYEDVPPSLPTMKLMMNFH